MPSLRNDQTMKTGSEMVADAQARIKEVSARDALAARGRGESIVFLDVRDLHEVKLGRIPGAVHVSRGNLETKIEAAVPRDARVIIYCASGNRSALAAVTMEEMGYADVASMAGGWRDWIASGGDAE
jgi:rhodanese-related sulfurtransferase